MVRHSGLEPESILFFVCGFTEGVLVFPEEGKTERAALPQCGDLVRGVGLV